MPGIRSLPGMRDENPQDLKLRTKIHDSLRKHLSDHGYEAIDTPLLEPTDLFLRKSGGELATRMYTFIDPGGNRVSIRPEFTSSVIRYYLERSNEESLPIRMQYGGPVLRYDESMGLKQFHQVGAEVIGGTAPESDGEILALAQEGLSVIGSPDFSCVIGHVGVLQRMLDELGLSHRAQAFLISSLSRIRQNPEEAQNIRQHAYSAGLMEPANSAIGSRILLDRLDDDEALDLLRDLFSDALSGIQGSRSVDEILTRFIQKLKMGDDPKRVEQGISLFVRIASVKNTEDQALSQVRSILQDYGISSESLRPLEEVLASFHECCPSGSLLVDMGLVRGIAYYTGMVFEILVAGSNGQIDLCGGGRYDGLIKALGGENDVPALGFAYTMENIQDLLR